VNDESTAKQHPGGDLNSPTFSSNILSAYHGIRNINTKLDVLGTTLEDQHVHVFRARSSSLIFSFAFLET
jgi:hypothetical protein